MAQLSNNPWLGVSPGAETGVRDWRVQGRHDRGPMDLSVSQKAQQGAAMGGALAPWGQAAGQIQPPASFGERWGTPTSAQNASQEAVAHGGVLGRIGEFLGRLGVNQDYEDGVMRDSSGGRLYPNPYGEGNVHENLYIMSVWHQEQMRKLRPQ